MGSAALPSARLLSAAWLSVLAVLGGNAPASVTMSDLHVRIPVVGVADSAGALVALPTNRDSDAFRG